MAFSDNFDDLLEAYEGNSVTFDCPLADTPLDSLNIEWLLNGRPIGESSVRHSISVDRTRLVVLNVRRQDSSTFSCRASNYAGEAMAQFRLSVLVPPQIDGPPVEDINFVEGQPLDLQCVSDGYPAPTMEWIKDGQPFDYSPERVELLNNNHFLFVEELNGTDAGAYTCVAKSSIGRAEKTFNIRVIMGPKIALEDELIQKEVVLGHPITFECPLVPNPAATDVEMSWTREGIPLSAQAQEVQLLDNGHRLTVLSAQREDDVRFACSAENLAGQTGREFQLTVLVPPSLSAPPSRSFRLIENQSLIIPCALSEGIPSPSIGWTKDGHSLQSEMLDNGRIQLLSEGQQLKLTNAGPDHPGEYVCTATNRVGQSSLQFSVQVLLRPALEDEKAVRVLETVEGHEVALSCPIRQTLFVQRMGQIHWLKDGEPVTASAEGGDRMSTTHSNLKLSIANTSRDDEGTFTCVASNEAGETRANFQLVVLTVPKILVLEKDRNRTVVEGDPLVLSCPAEGKPEPTISWSKEGESLTAETIAARVPTARISENGAELYIEQAEPEARGRFSCEAKNRAGSAEQEILVNVLVPPRIHRDNLSTDLSGSLGQSLSIVCPISGHPPPFVQWLKGNHPLDQSLLGDVYLSGNRQRLHFVRLRREHIDKYSCVARNEAGEDRAEFRINLMEEPKIDETVVVQSQSVNSGQTALLSCPVNGSPEPTIVWLKDGQKMDLSGDTRHKQMHNGRQLQIGETDGQKDSGRYTCLATNSVGSVQLNLFLTIVDPPLVEGPSHEEIFAQTGRPTVIHCHFAGTEPIQIDWLFGGRLVRKSDFADEDDEAEQGRADPLVQVSDRGRRLNLLSVQRTHNGSWTCIGRNRAGEARRTVQLWTLVPPTINDSSSSPSIQTVVPGSGFHLNCVLADGFPSPTISWRKDGRPLVLDDSMAFNDNQSLLFPASVLSDDGRYSCIAENSVGVAQRSFLVKIASAPELEGDPVEEVVLVVGDHTVLQCRLSNGSGEARIRWMTVDGEELDDAALTTPEMTSPSISVESDKLILRGVRLSDAGDFVCVADNAAGQARKMFRLDVMEPPRFKDIVNTRYSVIEGRTVMLDCEVGGSPQPTVVWRKDGIPLVADSEQYQMLQHNQRLHIEEVDEGHVGRYSCIAENLPGRAEKDIVVSLLKAPMMEYNNQTVEVAEKDPQMLECPLQEDTESGFGPGDTVFHWTKNAVPISPSSPNIQLSASARRLHLMRTQPSDAGLYTCTAKNAAGDADATFTVIVLVPPTIADPHGYRTLEALAGQTIQLECRASGIPTPEIKWSLNGQPLSAASSRIHLLDNSSLIRIESVQRDTDSGRYSCVATNKVGRTEMDIILEVIEPPRISVPSAEVNVVEGSEQRLECNVQGHPTPTVEWRKGGGELPPRDGLHAAFAAPHSHYLHIRAAAQEHAGRYTCIASNKGGEVRQIIQLNVLVLPTIAESERLLKMVEGGDLALECVAQGVPTPQVAWRRMVNEAHWEGKMMSAEGEAMGKARLLLKAINVTQAGRYTCEASNEAGMVSADFAVEVLVRPRIVPSPSNYQVRVVEGDRARMECRPEGNPAPTVRWLKAGRALTDMTNMILSPKGDALMVLKTRRNDAGTYTCVAENSVGETEGTFTVSVLVGPHINETLDQNPHVLKDQEVVLSCPVQGLPIPTVHWLKDGEPIRRAEAAEGAQGATELQLERVQPEHAGRYTCRANNEVGQLDTDFELEVIAPPQFVQEGQRNYEAVEGQSVTLVCPVEASPYPEISWMHGTDPIESDNAHFSTDNKQLTLLRTSLADGGKYVCRASNIAGHSEVDLTLRVLVPPRIDKSNLVNNPLAILGKEIFLECPASGIPQPEISWRRENSTLTGQEEGFVIREGNQSLGIRAVTLSHQGKYSCEVENRAGKLSEQFTLEVLVPPAMEETVEESVSRREGERLELLCPLKKDTLAAAEATRSMDEFRVVWTKDGRPLKPELNPNIEINGQSGMKLIIRNVSLADSGQYKCVASNRAGQSFHKFDLDILSKPQIDVSRNAPEPHVIAGRPITLWCPASGNPLPTVRWFLNGADIFGSFASSNRFRLLDQGQGLEIHPAAPEDVGLWTCQAENRAGTSTADISLDVWVEPSVHVFVEDNTPLKPVGESISLLCEVYGNPEPVISWSLRDQIIIPSPGRLHISKGGHRLEIPRLRTEDAGDYHCSAQNEVGAVSGMVTVEILVPPSISRETVELNPRLPMGRALTLFCDVGGIPPPELRWTKNGIPLDEGDNVEFGDGKRFVQIGNVSLGDRGVYRCEAINRAGNDTVEYRLDVYQSPIIAKGGTEQVVEGRVAVLECEASGEPAPVINWQRNGVLVEMGVRYALEESRLKVIDTRSSDSGIYVCVATNEAGTDQQAFTLEVLIPPKMIAETRNELAVAQGDNATLRCQSRGYPAPQIIWSIEWPDQQHFHPIANLLEKGIHYSLAEEGRVLRLFGLTHQGTRQYRCSAINGAGMDEMDFAISVIRPPILSREGLLTVNVPEGDPLHIPCGVSFAGRDGPATGEKVHWSHNGAPLGTTEDGQVRKGPDGALSVERTSLALAGNYTCTVKNTAGNATSTVMVQVGVPPKISEDGERARGRVIVERGATAELWCEAVGVPPPNITWLRDDLSLARFAPTAVTASEQSMHTKRSTAIFGDVQPDHAGVYTCIAENWAGKINKTVDLVVLIPPSVEPEQDQVEVELGQMVVLQCNASGIPEPLVSWVKNTDPPVDIVANEQKYQMLGTSLAIRNADKGDHGFYHCIARSEAGQSIGVRRVIVKCAECK